MINLSTARKLLEEAKNHKNLYEDDLADAYKYVLKEEYYLLKDGQASKSNIRNDDEVLDATATDALEAKTAEIQGQLFPVSRPFISLQKEQWIDFVPELEEAEQKFHAAIQNSNFYTELELALRASMFSMGVLIMSKGTPHKPFRFRAIPTVRCYHTQSETGEISHSFVMNYITIEEIKSMFGKLDQDLNLSCFTNQDLEEASANTKKHPIIEMYYTNEDGTTNYMIFKEGKGNNGSDSQIIYQQEGMKGHRFIAFRYRRILGSVMGWGRVMMALPLIRQLNTAQFYSFQNMKQALGGIYAFSHADINANQLVGSGNLKTLDVPPGVQMPQLIPGSSVPFDASNHVVKDLQQQIHNMIMGHDIPIIDQGVRSASEYQIRQARRDVSSVPELDNLMRELFKPIIDTGLEILTMATLNNSKYYLESFFDDDEQKLYTYEPTNPIAESAKRQKAHEDAQIIATTMQILPNEVDVIVDKEKVVKSLLSNGGVDQKYFLTEQQQAEKRQQMQAAQQTQQQPQPTNIAPIQTQ